MSEQPWIHLNTRGQTKKKKTQSHRKKNKTHAHTCKSVPTVGLSRDVGKWSRPLPHHHHPAGAHHTAAFLRVPSGSAHSEVQWERNSACMVLIVGRLWGPTRTPRVQHPKYHYSTQPATSTCAYLPSRQRGEVLTGISSRFRTLSGNQSSIFLLLCKNNAAIPRHCPAGDWSKYS